MGRIAYETVDYFSHDTDASNGKTLTILEGKYGAAGYAFWFKLLEWLGRNEGHYIHIKQPEDLEFLCRKLGSDVILGAEILDKLAELGAIDRILWTHKVIWCQKFVDRLDRVYKKRGRKLPQRPHFCDGNCHHDNTSDVISGTDKPIIGTEIPQSKVKYSIVKNTPISPLLFKKFWDSYPRKVAKLDAIKAFNKLNPDEKLTDTIIQKIISFKETDWKDQDLKYIPHPSAWINGRRWEDELGISKQSADVKKKTKPTIDEELKKKGL